MSLSDFFNSDKRTARGWDTLDKANGRPTTKEANARLMQAYKRGGLEMAEQALKAGACADLLIDGARVYGTYGGYTQYQYALLTVCARDGLKGFAEVLLRHGANREGTDTQRQWTPMHYAADRGDTAMVRMLLDAGANPGPLHYGQPYGIAHEKQYTDIATMIKDEPARREAQKTARFEEQLKRQREAEAEAKELKRQAAAQAAAVAAKAPSVTQTGQAITVMEPLKIKKPSR